MAIELTSINARHERRVRLVFSNTLAAGAFTSTAFYAIENEDGKGPSPVISQALVVPGSGTNVELALGSDLAEGALYTLTALAVPAADASVSTVASTQKFRFGVSAKSAVSQEAKARDGELLLYGRDAVWAEDYVENPEGDLDSISGVANVQAAQQRRLLGAPLPWDAAYGAYAYESVDLPSAAVGTLYGRLQSQAIADDRVRSAKVVLVSDDPEDVHFVVTTTLEGGQIPGSIPIAVNT